MSVLLNHHKRIELMEVNPLDKATIVSIYPQEVLEIKPTIQPGYFHIPAGSFKNPSLLSVGTSSWFSEGDEAAPILQVPVFAIHVAKSVIVDYCSSLLAYAPDQMPGIFFIPGDVSVEEVKGKYIKELLLAKARQDKWFKSLIKMADALWSRTNGNPLAIADQMRLAAREMGQDTKPWLADYQNEAIEKCIGCGSMKKAEYPICPNCKAITNREQAEKLGLSFAK